MVVLLGAIIGIIVLQKGSLFWSTIILIAHLLKSFKNTYRGGSWLAQKLLSYTPRPKPRQHVFLLLHISSRSRVVTTTRIIIPFVLLIIQTIFHWHSFCRTWLAQTSMAKQLNWTCPSPPSININIIYHWSMKKKLATLFRIMFLKLENPSFYSCYTLQQH
jgi:hypothetical protein